MRAAIPIRNPTAHSLSTRPAFCRRIEGLRRVGRDCFEATYGWIGSIRRSTDRRATAAFVLRMQREPGLEECGPESRRLLMLRIAVPDPRARSVKIAAHFAKASRGSFPRPLPRPNIRPAR